MNDQPKPLPPHVERYLDEVREALTILCDHEGVAPVRLRLSWRMTDKSFGSLERTYKAPKPKAVPS
ncbi:MAG: hypothetical protein IT564_11975 [Rhodospirillales bacterium]|nr:hypothetical protein [Rhodospirillales bacterium]